MKKLNLILIGLCIALAAQAQVHFKWVVESSRAAPTQFSCYRGETILLQPDIKAYGESLSNYTAAVYWQTNGMGSAWWTTNALVFSPAMDVGASSYTLFVKADTTNGTSYRANAVIRMLSAPGSTPNALPFPVQQINFATVSVTNAPWLLVESDPGIPAAIDTAVAVSGTNAQEMALAAQSASIAFSVSNQTTRLYNPSNTSEYIDGSGTKYVVSNHWEMAFSDSFRNQLSEQPPQSSYVFNSLSDAFTSGSWRFAYGSWIGVTGWYASYGPIGMGTYNSWTHTTNSLVLDPSFGAQGSAYVRRFSTTTLVDSVAFSSDILTPAQITNIVDSVKELHVDGYTNIIWRSVYSNGWMWLVAYTNYPAQ